MIKPDVASFFHEPTNTISYVVSDPSTRECAVIDPVLDYNAASGRTTTHFAESIVAFVRKIDHEVQWILETHVHADHLTAAPYIKERLGGRLAIGSHITEVQAFFGNLFNTGSEFDRSGGQFDHLMRDSEKFNIGNLDCTAIHTPGHTPACMSYVIGDAAFVGDTLFMPDFGTARADFPGGDARLLYRSIRRLFALPSETRLFLCHDYGAPGRQGYAWETTVAEQYAANVHVRDGISEDEFVAMRAERDASLDMPALMLPSVQINMRAGGLPPPEADGKRFLKIPLNAL